jgi:hypothetical protein
MNLDQILENMSEEEITQLLETDFGDELEKEASAELAQTELAEALYAYGALMADYEVASQEELSKEASAEFGEVSEQINAALEEALVESGILENDDTAELHKEAQAAAAMIFEGYADQLEKVAKAKPGVMKVIKQKLALLKSKGMEAGKSAGKFVKKHKIPVAVGATGLATAGGLYAYKKKKDHEKKASEITAAELAEMVAEDQAVDAVIFEGIEKMAAKAKNKVKKQPGMLGQLKQQALQLKQKAGKAVGQVKTKAKAAGKYMMKHKGPLAGALALGGTAGVLGHMATKKKEQE